MTVVHVGARLRGRARDRVGPLNASALFLLVPVAVLVTIGLMMVLSASSVAGLQQGSAFLYFTRQVLWAVVGIAAMAICSAVDYRRWRTLGYGLLAAGAAGLVAVLLPGIGVRAGGSSRWIAVGPLRLQPSEIAKLALILVVADLCVRKAGRLRTAQELIFPVGALAGLVGALVFAQPDLGTTLVLGMLAFTILFAAGASLPALGLVGSAGGLAAVVLALSRGYQRARIFSFLDPFGDRLGGGYQAVQSLIALGSGGVFGVGPGTSRQKWLYVPNAHTDFIFSILGEETGLIGTLIVVGLLALLAFAGLRIARRAPDPFGRLVAAGITAWIAGQAIVNVGAVTGLLPITGIPLPLVSFGGTALVVTLAGVGIMVNIARQEVWPPGEAERPVALRPRSPDRPAPLPARGRGATGRLR
ncbi:MAG: putative lipid II flippase FtsW [Acidobacteria bacterium]|nr:putative lipid II flippase FtsW [Acidobacteriota bacterium]